MVLRSDMKVELIDYHGDDLLVVNAARASFGKMSEWCYEDDEKKTLCEKDKRLINYLAKHNHWTPFGHPQVTFLFEIPIFVARQLMRHNIGVVWNERSRRYVSSSLQFYYPDEWRKAPDGSVKQGSSDEIVDVSKIEQSFIDSIMSAVRAYESALEEGVAPEMARMLLPQNLMTSIVGTGSLYFWSRVYNLRIAKNAQKEIRTVAKEIDNYMSVLYPESWSALKNK